MATMTISAGTIRRPSAPRVSTPVRLTARGRRLARSLVVLLAVLTVLAVGLIGRLPAQAGDAPAVAATTTVVVQPGQTLWQIARAVDPSADVRDTIERIADLNGLSGSGAAKVFPGQKLIVPAAA